MNYGLWVVLGMAIGAAIGWLSGGLAVGIGLGTIFGVLGGAVIADRRARRKPAVTSPQEGVPHQIIG